MNLLHFYRHESCGKCTPCREGCDWLYKLLQRLERGEGREKDLDLLFGVSNNIIGKTLCAFGDAAATPVLSTMKLFRARYEAHVREGRCTLPADWRRKAVSSREPTDGAADASIHHPARDHRLHVLHADYRVGAARACRAKDHGLHAAALRSVSGRPARTAAAAGGYPQAALQGGVAAKRR